MERILSLVLLSCDTTVVATYRTSSLVVHLTVSLHCEVLYRSLIKPLVVVVVVLATILRWSATVTSLKLASLHLPLLTRCLLASDWLSYDHGHGVLRQDDQPMLRSFV